MSSLYAEETMPVVKLSPYREKIGDLLGGIKALGKDNYEFIPTHDKWENWVLPPDYGIAKSNEEGVWSLQVISQGRGFRFPSHIFCLERHGNHGAALMRLSNVTRKLIMSWDNQPTGYIKKTPNEDIMIPFWKNRIKDVDGVNCSLCAVFPDSLDESVSTAMLINQVLQQRDYAFNALIYASHGIASAYINNIAKG